MKLIPGNVPPNDTAAEQALLGALLLGGAGNETCDTARALISGAADFYQPAHRAVYEAMHAVLVAGLPLDIVTLKEALERRGMLDAAGGVGYLMQIGDATPSISNAPHYAGIVADRALRRRLIEAASHIVGIAHSGDLSAADAASEAERLMITAAGTIGARRNGWQSAQDILAASLDGIGERFEARRQGAPEIAGIPTGLLDIDRGPGGLRRGDLVIVAGRPSMGKTACVCSIGVDVARRGFRTAVYSLEMTAVAIADRLLSAESGTDSRALDRGALDDADWQRVSDAADRLWDIPLHVDETPGLSVTEIATRARRLASREGGIDLVIVDYLQLCRGSGSRQSEDSRRIEVGEIARGLKALAKELDCSVVALSQVARRVEQRPDKRPLLSDLMESGDVEAHADVVVVLYRASYYAPPEQKPRPGEVDEVEWIVAKNRKGPTGTIKIGFRAELTQFVNLAPTEGGGEA